MTAAFAQDNARALRKSAGWVWLNNAAKASVPSVASDHASIIGAQIKHCQDKRVTGSYFSFTSPVMIHCCNTALTERPKFPRRTSIKPYIENSKVPATVAMHPKTMPEIGRSKYKLKGMPRRISSRTEKNGVDAPMIAAKATEQYIKAMFEHPSE
mmetsp:Transcript_127737/g.238750  ORF Transcript_127737/g.238750 Transcript_127737/m.238750 type:complete len:155 (+) Transcript_127737:439-903(+)